jgi:hypothetical protein
VPHPLSRREQHANRTTEIGTPPLTARQTLDRFTIKVMPGESTRARKVGCVTSAQLFSQLSENISTNTWVAGVLFDYNYARGDDVTGGVYLYGTVADEPLLMIRCFVPFDPGKNHKDFEVDMMELVASESRLAFHIMYKGWHQHESGDVMEGFGCLYAKDYSKITGKPIIVREEEKT